MTQMLGIHRDAMRDLDGIKTGMLAQGLTEAEADGVMKLYFHRDFRCIKRLRKGGFTLAHGALMDADTLRRAVPMAQDYGFIQEAL